MSRRAAMTRSTSSVVTGAAVLVGVAALAAAERGPPAAQGVADPPATRRGAGDVRVPAAAPRPVTIYLRRTGGTLSAGPDDSGRDVSSLAARAGGAVTVPAWRGGARRWRRVVACVRARYADFAVEIVGERPAGPHVMVLVGGRPALLGYPASVRGAAPATGAVQPAAVAYVFAEALGHDVEATCAAILHETGHTLGLDHVHLCGDPMSYLDGCGPPRWRDEEAFCGEREPRVCADGALTQSSWRWLAAAVGLRDPAARPAGYSPTGLPACGPE
jgi:hypothetical protein